MKRLVAGIAVAALIFAVGLGLARGRGGGELPQGATTVFSTTYYIRGVEIRPGTPLPSSARTTKPRR